mgnify:CR=1 FL=1
MKRFLIVLAVLAILAPALAMPPQPWGDNPEVCKVSIFTGKSLISVFTWYNNNSGLWECQIGAENNLMSKLDPTTYKSDDAGLIEINL